MLWMNHQLFFCTPQIIQLDLQSGKAAASQIVLLIFDEAHRAVGDYAYTEVMQRVWDASHHRVRVLALSATPGSTQEKAQEVVTKLNIDSVFVRDSKDPEIQRHHPHKEVCQC